MDLKGSKTEQNLKDAFAGMFGGRTRKRKMRVTEAMEYLVQEEEQKLIDMDQVTRTALERVERSGIIFLDEQITAGIALGGVLILAGMILTDRADRFAVARGETERVGLVATRVLRRTVGLRGDLEPDRVQPGAGGAELPLLS